MTSDFEYAMFYPRIDNDEPWRGPFPTFEEADNLRQEWEEDGFKPGVLVIRRRPTGGWEDVS